MATAIKFQEPVLSVAHLASSTPFYCVEEAEIGHSKVSVAYYNENDLESEIENISIPTKEILDFMSEFYGDTYSDHYMKGGEAVEEEGVRNHEEYLKENLSSVCTEYLNAKL